MMRRGIVPAGLLALAVGCGAIQPAPGSPAPQNTCQHDEDCQGYVQTSAPSCQGGRCLVTESAGEWTAVISLAQSAPYGPGAVFALGYSPLVELPLSSVAPSEGCRTGTCAQLPALVWNHVQEDNQEVMAGDLLCTKSAAEAADFDLGGTEVALPVQATFIPKWSVGSGSYVDATSLGLPLATVVSDVIPDPGTSPTPGPGGGTSMEFYVDDGLPSLVYERVLSPLPPFDSAYPPDVALVDLTTAQQPSENPVWTGFDATIGTDQGGNSSAPTFTFQRMDGSSLDGWTAYLRDVVTLRPFSRVAQLGGSSETVELLTNHHPASVGGAAPDALTGAQLVLAPAPGSATPTWLYTPVNDELLSAGTYPKLPPPVSVAIHVVDQAGKLAPADLVFEATDICRYALGNSLPQHDLLSANHDFAFVQRASADKGTAEVQLPLGGYRVTAVPRSAGAALTLVTPYALADSHCNPLPASPIQLFNQSVVSGIAEVADTRPLAAATVEFVPTKCSDGEVDSNCMPRGAQTITTTGGTFSMPLDPGSYLLRMRPSEGSGLPWVVQPLSVTATAETTAPITTIPAPVYAGLQLFDALGNPAVDALVQIFETPVTGTPYEIGEAVTDANGHFDMYLDPGAQ